MDGVVGSLSGALVATLDVFLGAVLISFPRAFTFVSVFAPFMWAGCHRGMLRFAIAISLTLPVFFLTVETQPLLPDRETAAIWTFLMFKEAMLGLVLGLLMSAPFWAAQLAGAALSIIRTESSDGSPMIGETPLTRVTLGAMICAFAYGNAPDKMLEIFYLTHELWPVDTAVPARLSIGWGGMYALVTSMLAFALSILMPFLIVITILELGLAFTGRFMKRMNVSGIALDIRALVILAMLTLSIGLIVERSETMLSDIYDAVVVLLRTSILP